MVIENEVKSKRYLHDVYTSCNINSDIKNNYSNRYCTYNITNLRSNYNSTIVILTYILMGLFGIPVFSSGGGMHYIFSPTFGYIIGFLFQAMIISKASNKDNKWLKYILSILGILVDYLFGSIYFAIIEAYYLNTPKDFIFIFNACINYFYIFDFIKIILACLIYSRIKVIYTISDYEKENTFIENKYKNEGI